MKISKEIIKATTVVCLLFFSSFFTMGIFNVSTSAEDGSSGECFNILVENFDTIWYDGIDAFTQTKTQPDNVEFIKASYMNGSARNIDYCIINLEKDPFYFSIAVYDRFTDDEGFPIDDADGYIYLNKTEIDNYFENFEKNLATKDIYYRTIEYQEKTWYRIYIEEFNPSAHEYYIKEYKKPELQEAWFTWGSNKSIKLDERPMFITQTEKTDNGMIIKFSHPTTNHGQKVSFSKEYLNGIGITKPVFEWG